MSDDKKTLVSAAPAKSETSGTRGNGGVSCAGERLREADMLRRWIGGTTASWRRIERTVGRGEGSSGFQFDLATTQR
ncbi:hypothetical protein ACYX34_08900 [Nitrospira sp. CMX1]